MRLNLPRRRKLTASLHRDLFRWNCKSSRLDITVRRDFPVVIDLSSVPHPLFRKYGEASKWNFGLTLTPGALLFHFRVPRSISFPEAQAGIDLNFHSADVATSDGQLLRVDLRPVTRVQERMSLKRQSIQRHIDKDLRHQRAVLRRYYRREAHRVIPLLHQAANELLEKAGGRVLVLEELTDATESITQRGRGHQGPIQRRRLSAWTHRRLVEIVNYKARTPIVRVNPEGTSSECPRWRGQLALPSGGWGPSRGRMTRQIVGGECGGVWHRDAAAAIAVLARGRRLLRGGTVPPSARNALLEAARWRSNERRTTDGSPDASPTVEPMSGDDAKDGDSALR